MQKLRPQEVDVLTYPNRAHMTFGASSPRVRFLDVYSFWTLFLIVKRPSQPHCNLLLANACCAVTSVLRDKPPPFQQVWFRCILQFQLILLLNRKPILLYLCYFVLSTC
jgi:hypothetical protein